MSIPNEIRSINFLGKTLQIAPFSDSERAILERDVHQILAAGNSFLAETFALNRDNIEAAARFAKYKLQSEFGGILAPDSEVGVSLIRPGHLMRDTTTSETPINTWDSDSIASGAFVSGNDYFIGTGSSNSTAVKVSQFLSMVVMGAMFTQGNAPVTAELYIQVDETTYPVIVLRHAWAADNPNRIRAVRFPPILVQPRGRVLAQVRSEFAGRQELVLLGLTFGMGSELRKQSYAAADLP